MSTEPQDHIHSPGMYFQNPADIRSVASERIEAARPVNNPRETLYRPPLGLTFTRLHVHSAR